MIIKSIIDFNDHTNYSLENFHDDVHVKCKNVNH